MTISRLGVDIAKNIFQLHGADNSGNAVQKNAWLGVNSPLMWPVASLHYCDGSLWTPCVRLVVVSNFLSILGGRSGMSNETIPRRTQAGGA